MWRTRQLSHRQGDREVSARKCLDRSWLVRQNNRGTDLRNANRVEKVFHASLDGGEWAADGTAAVLLAGALLTDGAMDERNGAIDERDDWGPFEAKIADIRGIPQSSK